MVEQDEINIRESSINQKPNNTMTAISCTGVSFVKKSSYLVAIIVLFDTAGLHLFTFCILDTYPFKDIELDISSYNALHLS